MVDYTWYAGDTVTLDVLVENMGSSDDQQTITLKRGSTVVDTAESSVLVPENSNNDDWYETIPMGWMLDSDDLGNGQTVEASSESSCTECSDSATVDIVEPFGITIDSVTSATAGEDIDVTVTVTNNSSTNRWTEITIKIGGTEITSNTLLDIDGGDSKQVTLTGTVPFGASSSTTLKAETVYNSASQSLSVTVPFDVTITNVSPSSVKTGNTVTVDADVKNTTGSDRTTDVDLLVGPDGSEEVVDTNSNLSVSANSTKSVSLTWTAEPPQGDTQLTVSTSGGEATDSVFVEFAPPTGSFGGDTTIGVVYVLLQYDAEPNSTIGSASTVKIENTDRGNTLYENSNSISFDPGDSQLFIVSESISGGDNLNGDNIDVTVDTSGDNDWRMSYGNYVLSNHVHQPLPGIIEAFSGDRYHPNNCTIKINGNELNADIPSIPESEFDTDGWEEVVDIRDELEPGQVNTIEITSTDIGHIQAWVEGDVYRQILGDG
jgi:hypothetical protein